MNYQEEIKKAFSTANQDQKREMLIDSMGHFIKAHRAWNKEMRAKEPHPSEGVLNEHEINNIRAAFILHEKLVNVIEEVFGLLDFMDKATELVMIKYITRICNIVINLSDAQEA